MTIHSGVGSKPHFPTNTVHTIRLCLFQSTRRPEILERIIETTFGKVRVKGRLGQAHLDVFESICYSRIKKRDSDGRIHLLVDPWEVKKKSEQKSGTTLTKIKDDLLGVIIEIIEPKRLACSGHLIDHIEPAIGEDDLPLTVPSQFGKRGLWTVKLGEAFCKLVLQDIWIGYDPAKIARLEHGISQAVTRHVLSHKNQPTGGWKIDTLIKSVSTGTEVSQEAFWKYRERIKGEAEKMAQIGVFVEGDRVRIS